MGNIPKKFVSLHSHSNFSIGDALDYPQEHIDFVLQNGGTAWALTDHGNMNGFAHAYLHAKKLKKEGIDFKYIPGCEMYLHPNLDVWSLQKLLVAAKKKGNEKEISELQLMIEEESESLNTKLVFGGINEDIVIESDEDADTLEDEDATKSSKFFNPLKRRHHLIVLPKTSFGLERLFGLVSKGFTDGFYSFPRIDYKMLKEAAYDDEGNSHLIVATACLGGNLSYEILRHFQSVEFDDLGPYLVKDTKNLDITVNSAKQAYDDLVDAVGKENVFLELQFNKLGSQHLVNRVLIEIAKRYNIEDKLIVTCDSHYSSPDKWKEREVYKLLSWMGKKEINPDSVPQSPEDLKCELYPKNEIQVWDSYIKYCSEYDFYEDNLVIDAIERTHDIAYNMIGDIEPDCTVKLPSYSVPEGMTEDQALIKETKEGLIRRGLANKPEYVNRVKEELSVIIGKKFSKYFLTTKMIVDIAEEIMFIGAGRGSGAGSLVNYCLGITDVEPIKYGLYFSRFLDATRSDYPDIDLDFENRDQLINMLKDKFGDENIIPITNFNRLKLNSLVKDLAKLYNLDYKECDKMIQKAEKQTINGLRKAKKMPNGPFEFKLEDAEEYSEEFQDYMEEYPQIHEPLLNLYKQNRNLSKHAGGCIVSENIQSRMPIIKIKGNFQTPWVEGASYKHLEHFGWIKFDLLGIGTLRVIHRAIRLILKRHFGIKDPTFKQVKKWYKDNLQDGSINWDDQKVYKVYHDGLWAGIFQCTNHGAQRLFQNARPDNLLDIAALTAIYRPGPLAMNVDKRFVEAKKNGLANIQYDHPILKEILESTRGCIVFQEQTMEIVNRLGNIPLEECNSIRKMMKPQQSSGEALKKAKALKERIVKGFLKNGLTKEQADNLYEMIMKFTQYSFNKSHALSYGMLSFQCAHMLTYFQEEWLCAYLEYMEGDNKKRSKAFNEVSALGYSVQSIDINYAEVTWTILPGKRFMPSFLSCKGIGEHAAEEIIENRPYSNLKDMLWNDDGKWRHSKFNKKAFESLIKIRAFRSMNIVGSDTEDISPNTEFETYKQMLETIIPNWGKIKKSLKRNAWEGYDNYNQYLLENSGLQEFTKDEIVDNEVKLFGYVNINTIINDNQIEKLREKNIFPICEYSREWIYWFVPVDVQQKKTKNGYPYLRMKITSSDGSFSWMNCWGWNGKTEVSPYTICAAVIKYDENWGNSCQWKKFKIL